MNIFYWFFVGIIFFSIVFLFYKREWYPKSLKSYSYSPWKLFWKIVSLGAIVGICYGIYLLICYLWPTPEHLSFRELTKNLTEQETKPYADRLKELAVKAKEKGLSAEEKKEAELISKKTENIRKNYSQGKLVPSSPKLAPTKPKEEVWDWTFEWEAAAEQLASGRQKIVGRRNDAQILSYNSKVLKFKYKRPSGKVVNLTLDRDDPETEFYFGRVYQSDLYLRVWLLPDEKGNFHGRFDNGPGKISMEVFLKKKL